MDGIFILNAANSILTFLSSVALFFFPLVNPLASIQVADKAVAHRTSVTPSSAAGAGTASSWGHRPSHSSARPATALPRGWYLCCIAAAQGSAPAAVAVCLPHVAWAESASPEERV